MTDPNGVWTSTSPFTVLTGNAAGQLITDPGFELANASWVQSNSKPDPLVYSAVWEAHSGINVAWLNGYGVSNTANLYQTVNIPSDASVAILTFFLKIETEETDNLAYDALQVQVRNTTGSVLQTLQTYSNVNSSGGWIQRRFDLTAYKGQTVRLHFLGSEDSNNTTSFFIDDINLNYIRGTVSLDLSIEGIHLTQVTQRFDGGVPLVRDRDGLVRVFVKANQINSAAPSVRVKFINTTGTLVATIPAPVSSVPTTIDEANGQTSWNVSVPGSVIQPGLQILAELDPGNTVPEATRDNNIYPPSGTPLIQNVRTLQPYRVTLVPVLQNSNGRQGDVTNANLETWLSHARKVYPLASGTGGLDATARSVYTTSITIPATYDANWTTLASEIAALRATEGSTRYYFGGIKIDYSGSFGTGVAANIPSQAAIGVDSSGINSQNPNLTNRAGTFAHEMGHCLGLSHAPCGGAGGPDPQYPYMGAKIGVPGFDSVAGSLYFPSNTDLMAYCGYTWISDYQYVKMLGRRENFPNGLADPNKTESTSEKEPVLLVWGKRSMGQLTLEPVFAMQGVPSATSEGDHLLQITTTMGGTISTSFALSPVEDTDDPTAAIFAFTIPQGQFKGSALHSLQVTKNGECLSNLGTRHLRANPQRQSTPSLVEWDTGKVHLSWDDSIHPLVMLRDSLTGEILSFARGGSIFIPTMAEDFEIVLSDGLNSEVQKIRLPLHVRTPPRTP